MVNPHRGEVALVLDGQRHALVLTLGALAELEEALGASSLLDIVERLEGGTPRARDVLALITAGLRGGGWRGSEADLLSAEIEGGPVEAARVAAQLLVRAFAVPGAGDA